jgi:dihydroxy-acid dehydratase
MRPRRNAREDRLSTGMRKGLTAYGDPEFSLFLRKAFIRAMGYSDEALDRPIVGIADTGSDFNPCHGNAPQLVEAIKRGVLGAGGLPMVFPTISLHESFVHPTSMYLRNLMAMETEEMLRAQPMDAVVAIGGCDKTIPAQLMAIASVDLPAIVVPVGPMLTTTHDGERLGACTDCRRLWAQYRAGTIDAGAIAAVTGRLAPTTGTCMVMGTASTMAAACETLGLTLPGGAAIPAVHGERFRQAELSGMRAVALAREGLRASRFLTPRPTP